jgi:hypothetical protein
MFFDTISPLLMLEHTNTYLVSPESFDCSTYQRTKGTISLEESPSGTSTSLTRVEIPNILWDPKGHYLVYNRRSLVFVPSLVSPVNIYPFYLRSILMLSYLCLDLPGGIFPSRFPTTQLCAIFPKSVTCPARYILLVYSLL